MLSTFAFVLAVREIIVTTIDGHRIVFGQELKPAAS